MHFMNCPNVIRFASRLAGSRRRVQRVILAALAAFPALVMAAPYELGQGYRLPFLGLTAGGYLSVQASALEGEKSRPPAGSKPAPAWRPDTDWHFFTEIEVSNPVTLSRDGLTSRRLDLDFERFYLDHNLSPDHPALGQISHPGRALEPDPRRPAGLDRDRRPLYHLRGLRPQCDRVRSCYGSWPLSIRPSITRCTSTTPPSSTRPKVTSKPTWI